MKNLPLKEFCPIGEYDGLSIVLKERGHHLQHILGFISRYNSRFESGTDSGSFCIDDAIETVQEWLQRTDSRNNKIEKYQNLTQILERLGSQIPWFRQFLKALIENAFWLKSEMHEWNEDLRLIEDIDVQVTYLLAYACNQISPELFQQVQKLQQETSWFDNEALSILKIWNADTSYIDSFLKQFPETKKIELDQMQDLVVFLPGNFQKL